MSQEALVVDPFEFAREGRCLEWRLPLRALPRVAAEVLDEGGELVLRIAGSRDRDGKFFLDVAVDGVLMVPCQRCLDPMEWVCKLQATLLLVAKGQPIPEDELEDDRYDAVEVGDRQDLLALVEDEVLLAMPVAPRHEVCVAPSKVEGASKESPFAGLVQWRGGKGSQ